MSTPYFAPELALRIAGEPIPAALRAALTSVQLQSSLNAAGRVEVGIANEGLRWLDHPLLEIDTELSLGLGYAPATPTSMFSGAITGHSATFPSAAIPTLTVAAQDRMRGLAEGRKARWFAIPIPTVGNTPLPDLAVTGIVAAENGLIPIHEPVGAALSVILGGVEAAAAIDDAGAMQKVIRKQEDESDFDFLMRIALENGWELLIDHADPLGGRKLRFFSPLDHLTPDLTLAYGRSLVDFTPRLSVVGQVVSVTAYVWVARLKTQLAIRVGWDWDRAELSIEVRPALTPMGGGRDDLLIGEPVTPYSAPRTIVSHLIPKLNQRLTGTGSAIGDPRIVPGAVIRFEGLGAEFGGLYRVTSATHTIDGSGYRTTFDVRKEIWFGSIPLPDQGAVPVRVAAPGLS